MHEYEQGGHAPHGNCIIGALLVNQGRPDPVVSHAGVEAGGMLPSVRDYNDSSWCGRGESIFQGNSSTREDLDDMCDGTDGDKTIQEQARERPRPHHFGDMVDSNVVRKPSEASSGGTWNRHRVHCAGIEETLAARAPGPALDIPSRLP